MKMKKLTLVLIASLLCAANVFADDSSSSSGSSSSEGSSSSSGSSSSAPRDRSSKLSCTLPDLNLVKAGIERSLKLALAGINSDSSVKVKVKLAARVPKVRVLASESIDGLSISVDGQGVPTLSGSLNLPDCSATLKVDVKIGNSKTSFQIPVSGALGSTNSGHN